MQSNTVKLFSYPKNIPVQLNPSPLYPSRQEQLNSPIVLLQTANGLHASVALAHSSISAMVMEHTYNYRVENRWGNYQQRYSAKELLRHVVCLNTQTEFIATTHVLKWEL